MNLLLLFVCMLFCGDARCTEMVDLAIPHMEIDAPVVHSGRYHILSCGDTYIVLDQARGLSIRAIGNRFQHQPDLSVGRTALCDASLAATLFGEDGVAEVSQAFDAAPRLVIIDQGPSRVAARVFFTLYSGKGAPFGSGTLDLYVYNGRIFLIPSLYIDYHRGLAGVSRAGFSFNVPGENAELIAGGSKLISSGEDRFLPFGADDEGFSVTVDNPGRPAVAMGWLRNRYPTWMYMRNVATNPQTDELYEKWPPWITQRGNPLAWNLTVDSGLSAMYEGTDLNRLEFLWANGDSLDVPSGGYKALNGVMAVMIDETASDVRRIWSCHDKPLKPVAKQGDFRYYNEFEGVYEIDSSGGDVDIVFDNTAATEPCDVFFRVWNLNGKGAWSVKGGNKNIPFGLFTDGDIIEDPMVPIEKTASGPARFLSASCTVSGGSNLRVNVTSSPGMQFTYQMYSALETMEAWSKECNDFPLFRFHIARGDLYNATLPGYRDYAFFKLPLYWMKNGVNNATFMNRTRGFTVSKNGPDSIEFSYTGTDLKGTGVSTYTVTVPYERDSLTLEVAAQFNAVGDGSRWTSLEYCDLYPFEHVYRRDFHYRDVIFLTDRGEFDAVGTGAWGGGFNTVVFPDSPGYYAEPVKRDGPGTTTPSSSDGTVWIIGDNVERGNILYRRGAWTPSPAARSVFSLCNAWVDVHNTVVGRPASSSREKIEYTIEVFRGPVPSTDRLDAIYKSAAGGTEVKTVTKVNYTLDGEISGFEVE